MASALADLPAKIDPARLFQVDLAQGPCENRLGTAVLREVERGVALLQRIAAPRSAPDLEAFCADIGLPAHIAERWGRFGVSGEMRQMFLFMANQRRRLADAVAEFEEQTHVGMDDFLRERGLI